jgi:hypothetical protein
MTTLTLRSEVGPDGTRRLEIPSGLPPGPVEVVLVVQPAVASPAASETGPRPDRPESRRDLSPHPARSGIFKDRRVEDIDIDRVLDEMNAAWKAKLGDLS